MITSENYTTGIVKDGTLYENDMCKGSNRQCSDISEGTYEGGLCVTVCVCVNL